MYKQTDGRKKIIAAIILALVFIIVINLPVFRNSAPSRFSRRMMLNAIYPFQYVFSGAFSAAGRFFGRIGGLWAAQRHNVELREELALLKAEHETLGDVRAENLMLRKSVNFTRVNPYNYTLVPAEIISRSPSNWFETVFINKGSSAGVLPGQAVICAEGVVGRTVEVGKFSSKVMLITDPESSIGVMKKGTGELGVAVGGAMSSLQVNYVGAGSSITDGDVMQTSGLGGIFPRGISVGVVKGSSAKDYDLFKHVELKPLTDFSRLNKVFVVVR